MSLIARLLRLATRLIRVSPIGDSAATRRAHLYVDHDDEPFGGYDITVPEGLTAPHCDNFVLHAPGECEYCDRYPEIQENRLRLHVRFTGHNEPADWAKCPAEQARDVDLIDRWPGNRARP